MTRAAPLLVLLLASLLLPPSSSKLLRLDGRRFLAAPSGPCTPYASAVKIVVRREGDIALRLQHSNTTTVNLVLPYLLLLSRGLLLNSSYSCTIFTTGSRTGSTLSSSTQTEPLLTILGAENILFTSVSLKNSITSASPACASPLYYGRTGKSGTETCPALYVYASHNIQYTKAHIRGRIELQRSMQVRLDHLSATMLPFSYDQKCSPPSSPTCNRGVIRILECGVPALQIKAGIIISNCEVYGSYELISIYKAAVGITINNNYLHHYTFAAVRLGDFVSNVMDTYNNYVANNYIYNPPDYPTTGDSGAIYLDTHWFNPNNRFFCNYIFNGDHCYYFDMATSGVLVDGGVCAGMRQQGVKFNTGKYNTVKNVLIYSLRREASYVSCTFSQDQFSCYQGQPIKWEAARVKYYDTPAFNLPWPYMKQICNPVTRNISGVPCNIPGDISSPESTGYCSGLPYLNTAQFVLINGTKKNPPNYFSPNITNVPLVNSQTYINVSYADAQFLGPNDWGVAKSSPIYNQIPRFRSCPKATVGVQRVNPLLYPLLWNKPRPTGFDALLTLDQKTYIINYNITLPYIAVPPP